LQESHVEVVAATVVIVCSMGISIALARVAMHEVFRMTRIERGQNPQKGTPRPIDTAPSLEQEAARLPSTAMMRFRLIERQGTKLAVAVVAATILVFQQALHYAGYLIQEIERRYHLDVVPGLTVLAGVFIFQEYRKRKANK